LENSYSATAICFCRVVRRAVPDLGAYLITALGAKARTRKIMGDSAFGGGWILTSRYFQFCN
jgi:hypothetical protein